MTKMMLVAMAGLLALTGAAMADQAVVVDGNLHTPAGDVPVEHSTGGLPLPENPVDLGAAADQFNDASGDEGAATMQSTDQGLRPNVRCSALRDVDPDGALNPACTQEPTLSWYEDDRVAVGPGGFVVKEWIQVHSGEVFYFVPEEVEQSVPVEQREALQAANDQVNAQAMAQLLEDSLRNGGGSGFRTPLPDPERPGKMPGLLGNLGFGQLQLGEGVEEPLPAGWEQLFDGTAPGLAGPEGAQRSDYSPNAETQGQAAGGDFASLAVMAAVVGGALLAPMALYHRIRSNNALNNKTRQTVYDAVVRTPGLGVNDAAKAATCSYSTAAYHLERLVEERLLICQEDGRRARYFKNGGAFSQSEREFVPILQSKECMDVLQVIVENPWCYRAEVAQKLGVSGPTVNWHLKKLMNVGVVKEMREGRVSYLYADKKALTGIGANLVGKLPEDLVSRLRFDNRPEAEFVEPALHLPETTVPEVGLGEYDVELAPLPEALKA